MRGDARATLGGWGTAALLLSLSLPLRAAPGDATRLSYSRTIAAAACPDREALRTAVAKRLGYDPFFPVARQAVEVDVDADGERLTANMRFVNEEGIILGHRRLQESVENCDELVASLALAISITLDPSAALEEHPAAAETSPAELTAEAAAPSSPEPPAAPEPAKPDPSKKRPSPRAALRTTRPEATWSALLRLGPQVSVGRLPSNALGARLAAGARRGAFQASLELGAFLPTAKDSARGGSVSAGLLSLAAAPCYAAERWAACALLDIGFISAVGQGVAEPQRERELYAAVGARTELRQPLGSGWGLVLAADGTKTLNPLELRLHDAAVWKAPPWSAAAVLGVEVAFP